MERRKFLQTSATGVGAVATPAFSQDKTRPNLLIIHCDELNFRTLGCYRKTLSKEQGYMWGESAFVETPHIDRIAREGAICTKFYAATPVCSPSRSTFLTGQYSHQTPVVTNNVPMADGMITFAEILRQSGYATGYSGKWHLDGSGKPQWAPKRKFGFEDNRYMFNRGHWKQFEDTPNGPRVKARKNGKPDYSVAGADRQSFATDFLCDKAIDFMREHKEQPFCYMVSIPDPHGPDTVRAPYDSMYSDEQVEKPRTYDKSAQGVPKWAERAPKCHYKMAQYHGMMKCIDDCVGRVLASLEALGILERTIVVFTADHGDMRGEHHRQNKGVPLEASAKIPFVIRFPESIRAGMQVDAAINTVDFLPTILAMMGVSTAGKERGRDVSALLTREPPADWDDIIFTRSTGKPGDNARFVGWVSAMTSRYKLLLSSGDDPWLLDLEEDPDELVNAIAKPANAAVVRRLARALRAYGKRENDPYLQNEKVGREVDALAV
jgi:arylsulfatase A-like enzyme